MQTAQQPLLQSDIRRLQMRVYKIRMETMPLLRQMYSENIADYKKSIELNNKAIKLKRNVLELGLLLDRHLLSLNSLQAPKGHGRYRYQERQRFAGKVGSLNDTLLRLKKGINALLRDMDKIKFGTIDFLNKQQELETFESIDHVDAVKLSEGDLIEQIDIVNAAIVLVILVIKALKKK